MLNCSCSVPTWVRPAKPENRVAFFCPHFYHTSSCPEYLQWLRSRGDWVLSIFIPISFSQAPNHHDKTVTKIIAPTAHTHFILCTCDASPWTDSLHLYNDSTWWVLIVSHFTDFPYFTDFIPNMSHISQIRKLRHRKNLSKIAQLASSGTGTIKRQHPLLPEKWPGWGTGPGIMTKFQSFREQTLNLSFLSGGLDPTKLKATEKHTEQLGKKTKYKVRSQGKTVGFFFFMFCFVSYLSFSLNSH